MLHFQHFIAYAETTLATVITVFTLLTAFPVIQEGVH